MNNTQSNRSSDKGRDNRRKPSFPRIGEVGAYTASALLGEARELTGPSCNFCKTGHESPNCPVFNDKSLGDRWKLVQENKLCFNCFKPSNQKHFSKICRLSVLWQIVAPVITNCCMVSN